MIEAHIIRERLDYDPTTGVFRWKVRPSNPVKVGDIAGYKGVHGLRIGINGTHYVARRLAWIYVHGSIPDGMEIYVRNRDESDIRIDNLELSTVCARMERHSMHRGNLLQVHGITRQTGKGGTRYRAKICRQGEVIHRSSHQTLEAAVAARAEALRLYEEQHSEATATDTVSR